MEHSSSLDTLSMLLLPVAASFCMRAGHRQPPISRNATQFPEHCANNAGIPLLL